MASRPLIQPSSLPSGNGPGPVGGGDACYFQFMPRVRLALGQFYGSARSLGQRSVSLGQRSVTLGQR